MGLKCHGTTTADRPTAIVVQRSFCVNLSSGGYQNNVVGECQTCMGLSPTVRNLGKVVIYQRCCQVLLCTQHYSNNTIIIYCTYLVIFQGQQMLPYYLHLQTHKYKSGCSCNVFVINIYRLYWMFPQMSPTLRQNSPGCALNTNFVLVVPYSLQMKLHEFCGWQLC